MTRYSIEEMGGVGGARGDAGRANRELSEARRAGVQPRPPCPTRPTAEELGGRPATAERPERAPERAGAPRAQDIE